MSVANLLFAVTCFFIGHDWTVWRTREAPRRPWSRPGGKRARWQERHCFRCELAERTRPESA